MVDDFLQSVFVRKSLPSIERKIDIGEEIDISSIDVMLIAVCIPNACSPSELFEPLGMDNLCHTKDQNKVLDAGDTVCLYVKPKNTSRC